jgi:arylsulfatase A-like enzyme
MNIVIIGVDALRTDVLPPYGGELDVPTISKLARESILFRRHYTHIATTLPSFTSLFTSLYPREHGVLNNGMVVPSELPTLSETLQAIGYQTAGFVSAAVLDSDYGISRGFEVWEDEMESQYWVSKVAGPKILSDEVTKRALTWLNQRDTSSPFCLFMHYFDPHNPENIPLLWGKKYPSRNYLMKKILYHKLGFKKLDLHKVLTRRNSWYYGAVSYTDYWIGQLFAKLEENGLYDDTLIILTADHGEGLGDHAWVGHAAFLYEEQVRVPFLVKLPNQQRAGNVVDGFSEHVDVMPTILEIIDVNPKSQMSGSSLWASLLGNEPVVKEMAIGQRQQYDPDHMLTDMRGGKHPVRGEQYYLTTHRYKFIIETNGQSELYDLTQDPKELRNIADERPDVVQKLHTTLEKWKKDHPLKGKSTVKEDQITHERLRALGYID